MTKTVFITGANRGIGLEFVRQLANSGWRIFATCREPDNAEKLNALQLQHSNHISIYRLDITDHVAINRLAERLAQYEINLLLNNAGRFGDSESPSIDYRDTQSLLNLDYTLWGELFSVNCISAIKITAAFLPHLRKTEHPIAAAISTRLSSITQNDGGVYAYRSSKAALNAAMKSLSADLREHNIRVVVLSPGWVNTEMGGETAPLQVSGSVAGMINVLDNLSLKTTGVFLDYQGDTIPW